MTETHDSSQNLPDTLTAAQAVAAGVDFAGLDVSSAGLFWNEYRPEDGACRIWHWYANSKRCLTPQGFSVRSRVYEYGGGSFCLADDALVFVNERDQQLYRQALDASVPVALTQGDKRYGGVFFSNGQVLAVEEDHNTHRLVAIDVADGLRQLLAEGADFYASPIVSADGKRLAWVEWQRPHQPWTHSRLMCAAKQDDGQWGVAVCIAGDGAEESLQQPRFDAKSRLYCLTDRGGFWQPWGETPSGFAALAAAPADHASAPWQLGSCTWLPINDGYLASWSQDGSGVLGLCQADGSAEDFSVGYSRFHSLAVDEEFVYCIAASAVSTAAVLAISRADHSVHVLAGGGSPLPAELISRPQALCYPSGGAEPTAISIRP